MTDDGEEVVGRPDVFEEDQITITSTGVKKTYCTNCRKNEHCLHGIKIKKGSIKDGEPQPTVMLKDKCKGDCECRCRRFFSARNGKLYPLDTIDHTDSLEGFNMDQKREAIDDIIDQANALLARKVQPLQPKII